MSRTIHYYNCFIKRNGTRTTINLSTFLDRVYLTDPNDKFRVLRFGEMSLPEMIPPDPTNVNTFQNRSVGIAKYREKKPYTGQKRTDEAKVITADVLEMTSVVVIPHEYLMLIEYNHYGARPTHIQSYLDSFLPKFENDFWEVELISIEPERGFADVQASDDIRYIEFKMNLQIPMPRIEDNADEVSLLGELLQLSRDAHESFGANTATICFGNGRHRQDKINAEDLIKLLRTLDMDSDAFESVKVKYRSPQTGNIEFVDLKHAGILKRIILNNDDNNGWEYIATNISEDFFNNNRPGSGYCQRHTEIIVAVDLPPLIENN